jgi:hypothetical protein
VTVVTQKREGLDRTFLMYRISMILNALPTPSRGVEPGFEGQRKQREEPEKDGLLASDSIYVKEANI